MIFCQTKEFFYKPKIVDRYLLMLSKVGSKSKKLRKFNFLNNKVDETPFWCYR